MGNDRKRSKITTDDARNGLQRSRPPLGRTSGPTRKSTRGKWTPQEDEILRVAVQRFQGKNWKKIAECIKGRTDVQCLHRWQKVLNPELVKGPWTQEEDEIIVALVTKHGARKWSTIAQHLPGRIGKQCRERWHNHLNPNINKEAWTQDEELTLIRAHQLYGNKWAELSKFLPGRSDNAIKNHWNSSVKKKLDIYIASGLLSQFEGFPLVSHQDQSVASSPSKLLQSCDADGFVKIELEEECSQISGFSCASQSTSYATTHPGEDCRVTGDSSPMLTHDGYFPEFEEPTFSLPEEHSEIGNKFPEHDLPLCVETSSSKDWQVGPNNHEATLPFSVDSSDGLNSSASFVDMLMGVEVPALVANSETVMDDTEAVPNVSCPSETNYPSVTDIHEAYSSGFHYMPSDMLEKTPSRSLSFPSCPSPMLPGIPDGFIYSKESESSLPVEECYEKNDSPGPIFPDEIVLEPPKDSPCSLSKETTENKRDEKDAGTLCYEPPHFPSFDMPFFSCDLVQSGNDLQQEFSPFGIRQLMMMSSLVPIKLWDSPSRDDTPEKVLRSAAKTFSSTPSILKKRHRDFLSPLSERRTEKKIERNSRQDTLSSLSGAFSRLDVMLDECACKSVSSNKENLKVSCSDNKNVVPTGPQIESSKSLVISECDVSPKEFKSSELLDRTTDNRSVMDVRNAVTTVKDLAGVLTEHDANDLLISSLDQTYRKLDFISKHVIFSSSENSCLSVICSPPFSAKKRSANLFSEPGEKAETTCKGAVPECSGMYIDTPLKRIMESPSAWKSPWFLKTFVPGPTVDTELTLEDMGYFVPGDCTYDAIGLMKQLGERTAETFADETPDTIAEARGITLSRAEPNNEQIACQPSSKFTVERRALDFSAWGSPESKSAKPSSSVSSYLLKECR